MHLILKPLREVGKFYNKCRLSLVVKNPDKLIRERLGE